MALDEVGRVGIRAIPDTTRFAADLNKALNRVEKAVKVKIQATVELSNASIAAVQKKISGLEATIAAKISDESMRKIQDQVENIEATATIDAVTETAGARASLITLARPRVATIHVRTSGLHAASVALARISGARVLGNTVESVGRALGNLDRSVPKIAAVSTAIAGLSGILLAGLSNSLALGASIASIAGASLALPGIIAGFGVGLAVMVAALKDTGAVLADLGPAFSSLQDSISSNFWNRAADPIRELVGSLLPTLRSGLANVASDIGGLFGSVATAFQSSLGGGVLTGMLANLSESIRIATGAVEPLVGAFTTLGTVGSSYLQPLAGWFTEISNRFNDFVQSAAASGQLTEWTDSGIDALQALGSVIANTGSIFAGLSRAAEAAGGASLQMLADGLGRVADVVNGPVFQTALTTIFEGAHAAMEGLGEALAPVGAMFVALAPTLARVLEVGGQIAGAVLGGIASALAQPVFANGLTAFFEGIQAGVEAILPVLPMLAAVLGQVGSVAGTLGATLGPVLASAFAALAPVVQAVLEAVQPLIPILGGALVAIISAIAPGIQAIVSGLVPLIGSLISGLAPIIATLAETLLPPLLSAIAELTPLFATVLSTLIPFVTALVGELAPVLGSLVTSVLPLFMEMMALLAPMFATVAATILPLVMSLVQQLAPVLLQIAAELIPVLMQAMATLAPVIMGLLAAILPLVVSLVTQLAPIIIRLVNEVLPPLIGIFSTLIAAIAPLITQIASLLIPIIQALMPVIVTVFGVVVDIITSAMKVIQGVIQVVTGIISGDWSQVWEGIKATAAAIWGLIKTIISGAIAIVLSVIKGVLGTIKAVWDSMWERIKTVLSGAWANIKSSVSDGINGVLGFMRDLPGKIMSALGDLGGLLLDSGASLIQGFLDGIASIDIGSVIGGVMDSIRDFFPFSPAKTGPFSGRGYTTYSGKALVGDFAAGMESQADKARAAASLVAGAAQIRAESYYTPADEGGASSGLPESLILEVEGERFRAYTRRESVAATGGALTSARSRLEAGGKYAHLGGLV